MKVFTLIIICFFSVITNAQNINQLNETLPVGIGTNSPNSTLNLHVVGSTIFDGVTRIGTLTDGGVNNFGMYWPVRSSTFNDAILHCQSSYLLNYSNPSTSSQPGLAGVAYPASSTGMLSSSLPLILGVTFERMRIASNGLIGIGTPNPAASLDIQSSSVPFRIFTKNSVLQRSIGMYSFGSATGGNLFTGSATPAPGGPARPLDLSISEVGTVLSNYGGAETGQSRFRVTVAYTNDANQSPFAAPSYYEALVVNNNGNVGLGVTNPNARFHLKTGAGSVTFTGDGSLNDALITGPNKSNSGFPNAANLALYSSDASGIDRGGSLVLGGKFSAVNDNIATYAKIKAGKTNDVAENYSGYLSFYTRNHNSLPSERLRIDNLGKVGIGTLGPRNLLSLVGQSNNLELSNDAETESGIILNDNNFPAVEYSKVVYNSLDNKLNFYNASPTPAMSISKVGIVGIGTTTGLIANSDPYKLYVEGGIRTRKVKVDNLTNWPDYVFEASFKLRSLTELETFIKINKHLPDIPSANEVAIGGIDLGESQAIFLKKIEELTLYVIELNKKSIEQEKIIEQQKTLLLELAKKLN